jgi:hypothetical protein
VLLAGLVFAGAWVWRWKDWIDRRFMRKFNALPEMAKPPPAVSPVADETALREISAIAMRCGGCGAKVGASVLSRALAAIEPAPRVDGSKRNACSALPSRMLEADPARIESGYGKSDRT